MPSPQLVRDAGPAVALAAAVALVFALDRGGPAGSAGVGPDGEAAGGTAEADPGDPGNLIQPARRGTTTTTMKAGSVYSQRTAPDRQVIAQKQGASPISEAAVEGGFKWLARHQAQDGSWSSQCLGRGPGACCTGDRPCGGPGQYHPVAQTGLALLAFQGGGHYAFNDAAYSVNVRRGLHWLVGHQQDDGNLARGSHQFVYEHLIGTFALAEACALARHAGEEPDPAYLQAAQKAVGFLERLQDRDGGWRYTANTHQASDTSVSGWAVLALKSAQAAELKFDPTCIGRAIQFFQTCEYGRQTGETGYMAHGGPHTQATTGVGMLVHHFLIGRSDTPLVNSAAGFLADLAERTWRGGHGRDDYYTWYNCTLGLFLAGGEPWERWNKVVRDRVVGLQVKLGCEEGSWPPTDQWGPSGGRVYSTALAILTLEVYYRFAKKDGPAADGPSR